MGFVPEVSRELRDMIKRERFEYEGISVEKKDSGTLYGRRSVFEMHQDKIRIYLSKEYSGTMAEEVIAREVAKNYSVDFLLLNERHSFPSNRIAFAAECKLNKDDIKTSMNLIQKAFAEHRDRFDVYKKNSAKRILEDAGF